MALAAGLATRLPRRATGASLRALVLSAGALGLCGCDDPLRGSDAAAPAADAETDARLVLLGTGTPNADPDRSGPAAAVVVNGEAYLVDAGPGVVRRAAAAAGLGLAGLEVERLRRVFITHLHSDHTLGLPDLIFTPWVLERSDPLEVYGPPGIGEMVEHLSAAYGEDVRVRLEGLEPANDTGYRVVAHEVMPGVVYEDEHVRVTAFAVPHGSWKHAYGYRFDAAGRSIVFSGDTGPSESVVAACAGCDVLVHEVYSASAFRDREPVWQRYHAAFHTSSTELAAIAGRARPGLLVLYHQLLWGVAPQQLLAEIGDGWDGEVRFGRDLDVY